VAIPRGHWNVSGARGAQVRWGGVESSRTHVVNTHDTKRGHGVKAGAQTGRLDMRLYTLSTSQFNRWM